MYYLLFFDFTINNLYFIQINIGDKRNEQYYVVIFILKRIKKHLQNYYFVMWKIKFYLVIWKNLSVWVFIIIYDTVHKGAFWIFALGAIFGRCGPDHVLRINFIAKKNFYDNL